MFTGRIYISRDVVFDEEIFPFSKLHDNAGARLRAEIFLLPSDLVNAGVEYVDNHVTNDPVIFYESVNVQQVQETTEIREEGANVEGFIPVRPTTSSPGLMHCIG